MAFLEPVRNPYEIEFCVRQEWNLNKGDHFHNCYELYYLAEGEITYLISKNIYTVKTGDLILIPPEVPHKTMPCLNQRHKRILIYLTQDFMKEFLSYDPELFRCFDHGLLHPVQTNQILRILNALLAENKQAQNLVFVKALLGELLVLLNRCAEEKPETLSFCTPPDKILEIVHYIDKEYAQELTLDILAKKFYLSPAYLSRAFHKTTGISFSKYLIKVRLNHASFLLLNTDMKITKIAEMVGFQSDNHFCKMFRQVVGISPRAYRKSALAYL